MLPFERLRALARYSGDDRALVVEAAECLGDFSADPAQLVTVCRRLLAHHPANGSLWWLCAHILAASDAATGARDAARSLERDRTADRLASLLPFPHDDAIAVLGWPDTAAAALTERPDLDVVSVRARHRRMRAAERRIRVLDDVEVIAAAPSHLLIEVRAASPTTVVVPDGAGDLHWALEDAQLWFVIPAGALLPERLFEVLRHQLDNDAEVLDVGTAQQVAGPWGLDEPARLGLRVDCPVAPELLRL